MIAAKPTSTIANDAIYSTVAESMFSESARTLSSRPKPKLKLESKLKSESKWFTLHKINRSMSNIETLKKISERHTDPKGGKGKKNKKMFFLFSDGVVVGSKKNISKFMNKFMSKAYGKGMSYNSEEHEYVQKVISIMKTRKNGNLSIDWPKPRDLMYDDMVSGGIVNGTIKYKVGYKSDGVRVLLYVGNGGAWIVSDKDFKLLTRFEKLKSKSEKDLVFDCELMEDGEVIVFDCPLMWDTDGGFERRGNAMKEDHDIRLSRFDKMLPEEIKNKLGKLKIKVKTFVDVHTPADFFRECKDLLMSSSGVDNDGLIFIPNNTQYHPTNDKGQRVSKLKRQGNLTQVPSICKWKPADKLTVDFLWNPADQSLKTSEGKSHFEKGGRIDFEGVEAGIVETLPSTSGGIVNVKFIRRRDDKVKPNSDWVISRTTLKLLRDPITTETMSGETVRLMRKYHLRIKRSLFAKAHGERLLDIGSGKGADVFPWKKYDEIYAVEPNEENIKVLKERLGADRIKVTIINAKGQETAKIKEVIGDSSCDVVAIMLSMTFFWESEETLSGLINTIIKNTDRNSMIIFMTMSEYEKDLQNSSYSLKLTDKEKGEIKINFTHEGAIVKNQTEWLVNLEELKKRLGMYGFRFSSIEKATTESMLNERELELTKLYSYGYFKYSRVFGNFFFRLNSNTDVRSYRVKPPSDALKSLESVSADLIENIEEEYDNDNDDVKDVYSKGKYNVTSDGVIIGKFNSKTKKLEVL